MARKKGQSAIGRKIRHLKKKEGKTQEQAVGQALGMARHGDLGPAAKRAAGPKPRQGKSRRKGKKRRGKS